MESKKNISRFIYRLKKYRTGNRFSGEYTYKINQDSGLYKQIIEFYKSKIKECILSFPNEENFLEALKKEYKPNTLCHNDFVQGNILYSDTKDYLIDYEYAAKNDYRFDIASFFSENNIHYIDQRDQFYQTYFDGEIDPMIDVQVQAFERMEDILWGYWANMLYEQRGEQIYFDIAKDKEKHYRG